MRLLTRYILKELFLPFLYALLIIIFILFINFFLRAIDRFLGKGLDAATIFEYLFLNLAWIVALAVPMAVLIATLMTFGRLSEDNEITAMRASGISFLSILRPALWFGLIVSLALIYFNNFVLPEMNFYARLLSGDIHRKRPDLEIEPGHFIDNIPDYSMIIKGKTDGRMQDVRIFSKSNTRTQTSIYAQEGELSTIRDAFVLTLYKGEIHELDLKDYGHYRRINFDKHVILISADNLMLTRRDTASRSDREMTIPMMRERQRHYDERMRRVQSRLAESFQRVTGDSLFPADLETATARLAIYNAVIDQDSLLTTAEKRLKKRRIRSLERQVRNEFRLLESYRKTKNKYSVEIHKKFSLPVACILFVMLGAPLGTLAKKGGFMVAISLGFGFFLVYYVFLIGGEEMADRDIISPAVAMWAPNVIVLIVAGYLTLHTVRERAPVQLSWSSIKHLFRRSSHDSR